MKKKNIYNILKWNTLIKSPTIKLFGIWILHCFHRRYIGIFLDPVLACNFRCRMCYFSDPEKRKNYKGIFKTEDLEFIAKSLFHRALKLQIGCGAEPTMYKDLCKVIALGKQYGIPYISITTNGNLLTKEWLEEAIKSGLDELTLSLHGMKAQTYEFFMTNGKFDLFLQLLENVNSLKEKYPKFKLRINYTINKDNMDELKDIWNIIKQVDILQLRPIQKIGNGAYQDFSMDYIYDHFDEIILPIKQECIKRNITCIIPQKENLITLQENKAYDDRIEKAVYVYVSPQGCWKDDFDYKKDSFESYSKRTHIGFQLLKSVFQKPLKNKVNVTRKTNYKIE